MSYLWYGACDTRPVWNETSTWGYNDYDFSATLLRNDLQKIVKLMKVSFECNDVDDFTNWMYLIEMNLQCFMIVMNLASNNKTTQK